MTHIINICSSFMPADIIGGPSYCGFDLLSEIDKVSSSVILSFDEKINKKSWDIKYNQKEKIFNSTSHYFFRSGINGYLSFIKSLILTLKNKDKKIFILHGIYNIPYVIASVFLKILNCNIYLIPHGTLSRNSIRVSQNFLIKYFSTTYMKTFHTRSNYVFSNKNEYNSSIISKYKYKFKNIYFIPNILTVKPLNYYLERLPKSIKPKDSGKIKYHKKNLENSFTELAIQNEDSLNLIYFGRISIEKGLDKFLESLISINRQDKFIDKIHIHLIGNGEEKYIMLIKNILKNTSFKVEYTFYGWMPRDNALELIKNIKGIMIFPSITDNFNLSFLESILIGKFAIVSKNIATSNDDWVKERVFLLDINDINKSLRDVLKEILNLNIQNKTPYDKDFKHLDHPYKPEKIKNKWEKLIKTQT